MKVPASDKGALQPFWWSGGSAGFVMNQGVDYVCFIFRSRILKLTLRI